MISYSVTGSTNMPTYQTGASNKYTGNSVSMMAYQGSKVPVRQQVSYTSSNVASKQRFVASTNEPQGRTAKSGGLVITAATSKGHSENFSGNIQMGSKRNYLDTLGNSQPMKGQQIASGTGSNPAFNPMNNNSTSMQHSQNSPYFPRFSDMLRQSKEQNKFAISGAGPTVSGEAPDMNENHMDKEMDVPQDVLSSEMPTQKPKSSLNRYISSSIDSCVQAFKADRESTYKRQMLNSQIQRHNRFYMNDDPTARQLQDFTFMMGQTFAYQAQPQLANFPSFYAATPINEESSFSDSNKTQKIIANYESNETEKMNDQKPPNDDDDKDEVDFFRDTNVRYLGYANEIGESFRFVFPQVVPGSYVVAFGYVFADTADKFFKGYNKDGKKLSKNLTIKTMDCLIWQTFASVICPGSVIHYFVGLVNGLIVDQTSIEAIQTYGPSVTALAVIPLIVHPIDNAVEFAMEKTYRQVFTLDEEEA